MPAYNEASSLASTIIQLARTLHGLPHEIEVLVVNDGSTDATRQILASLHGVRAIHHAHNRGYGASLKTGIRQATGDWVVFFDADGQHDPADVSRLLDATGNVDMVVGARQGGLGSPMWRMPGKWLLSKLANYLTREKIPDLNSGLRAVRRSVLVRYVHLCPNGFSFTTTLTMALCAENCEIAYIPTRARPRASSNQSTVKISTGFETILLLMRLITLFNPMRVFLPTSLTLLVLGLGWSSIYIFQGRGLSVGGMLLLVTALLVFFAGLIADQVAAIRREMYREH